MTGARAKPSIRDVAALAGVSYQTVSRVLNTPERVHPDTAARVQDAIDALGYRPSRAARSLARRRSNTIGVVSVQQALFGPAQMTQAIDEVARQRQHATAVVTLRDDGGASLEAAREHLLSLGVDAVIVIAWSEPVLALAERFSADLPTCVVAEGPVPDGLARVSGNHRLGGELAATALLDAGRSRLGHLAGPADWLEARARMQGWREAAGERGQAVVTAGWSAAAGYGQVEALLAEVPDLDAIFAANDLVAIGALRRLTELGRRVPEQVALIGYDDIEVAGFLSVPLASIRQPFADVGSAAIEVLFQVMEGAPAGERILAPELVPRASLGRR